MSIKVRYFASLAERMGRPDGSVQFIPAMTVFDVWRRDTENQARPDNLLAAVNMVYADFSDEVQDGDEVAFFPPVTGG